MSIQPLNVLRFSSTMPFITTIVTLIPNVNSVTTKIFYKNGGVKFEDLVTLTFGRTNQMFLYSYLRV